MSHNCDMNIVQCDSWSHL